MGGGHLGVNVFAKGDCSRQNAEKLQKIMKNFRVPPRCQHSNTQMSPPPPVACPVRHLTTKSNYVRGGDSERAQGTGI